MPCWQNWQMHLPAKQGPGDRHPGSRPGHGALLCRDGVNGKRGELKPHYPVDVRVQVPFPARSSLKAAI